MSRLLSTFTAFDEHFLGRFSLFFSNREVAKSRFKNLVGSIVYLREVIHARMVITSVANSVINGSFRSSGDLQRNTLSPLHILF